MAAKVPHKTALVSAHAWLCLMSGLSLFSLKRAKRKQTVISGIKHTSFLWLITSVTIKNRTKRQVSAGWNKTWMAPVREARGTGLLAPDMLCAVFILPDFYPPLSPPRKRESRKGLTTKPRRTLRNTKKNKNLRDLRVTFVLFVVKKSRFRPTPVWRLRYKTWKHLFSQTNCHWFCGCSIQFIYFQKRTA